MPLIKCPMCGKDISSNALSCPNCGEPMKQVKRAEKYKVQLNGCCEKIKVIKVVREIRGVDLKEAKEIVDSTPSKIVICDSFDEAQKISEIITGVDYRANVEIIGCVGDEETDIKYTVQSSNNSMQLIKCPNCKSTDTHKISTTGRIVSGFTFGIFSSNIGKTWKCNNCGYKW